MATTIETLIEDIRKGNLPTCKFGITSWPHSIEVRLIPCDEQGLSPTEFLDVLDVELKNEHRPIVEA